MSRTDKALEKLPKDAFASLKQSADLLAYAKSRDASEDVISGFRDHALGYLSCLQDMGVITQTDNRLLRVYFL